MKKTLYAVLFAAALISVFSCKPKVDPANPYNLDLVNTYERYEALMAEDPDMELVDLEELIPGIVLDIRYATENNFTGKQMYPAAKAYLRAPVAKAISEIQAELAEQNLALKIYDAYRPYAVTLYFWEVQHDTCFVAAPWRGSPHNKGYAVDVSLMSLETGEELQMPTEFDCFTEKASPTCMDLPQEAIDNRQILIDIMAKHDFTVNEDEWWHYNYKDRAKYPVMDISFAELEAHKK